METTIDRTTDIVKLRRTARRAGLIYLILFAAGIFAEFVVRSQLIVPGEAAATAAAIRAGEQLFRFGILADLVMIVSDIALAILFYELFRSVSRVLALSATLFRLTQAVTLAMNLINLFYALDLAGAGAVAGVASADSLALLFAGAHATGYAVGLLFFAVNLAILGVLVIRSGLMPRLLGILLVIAAAGYAADTVARTLLIDYDRYASLFDTIVFTPAVIAEFAMLAYLLIRGVRDPRVARPCRSSIIGVEEQR